MAQRSESLASLAFGLRSRFEASQQHHLEARGNPAPRGNKRKPTYLT